MFVGGNVEQSERSSVVERCPDKTEVEGPIPSARTKFGTNFCASEKRACARFVKESDAGTMRRECASQ